MNIVSRVKPWHCFCSHGRAFKTASSLHHHLFLGCAASSVPMEGSTGGGLASSLWNNHRLQAILALYHPFVVSLAAGVLDIRSFRHYIAQDTIFLKAFGTAYGLARDNADDDLAKLSISQLQQDVIDELKLHAQASGGELSVESNPTNATLKYTQFLLETARGKESGGENRQKLAALTIGAMTPCMRLYAYLGQEIVKHTYEKFSGNLYRDWIDTYSSKAFQSSALKVEQLLERLAADLCKEDIQELESLYSQAMILELEFFSAQPYCQCPLLPFIKSQNDAADSRYVLMTDFDLTCSVADSCSALASVSIKAAIEKDHDCNSQPHQKSSSELKQKWDFLNKSYNKQFSRVLCSLEEQEDCHRDYDVAGLRSFLENLSDFEIQSNSEIVKQRVFEGLKLEDVRRAGGEMALLNGCSEFFRQVSLHSHVDAHIVSVCWSKAFIEGALSKEGMDFVEVHANELSTSDSCTSGELVRAIETPLDKERVFDELMRNAEEHAKCTQPISIYVGDSVTDLLCLLKADLGIVIGENAPLERATKAFGVSMVPLYKRVLEMVKVGGPQGWQSEGILYTVTNWDEIHALLFGFSDTLGE